MSALESASKYLNNLLLARGLLQNGKPIDFACADRDRENRDVTMTQVVNLVHELVLRRDREAEQHEAMTATIRSLRVEESQRVLDLQRVQDKNIQLKCSAATAEAQERSLKITLKRAETQIRDLKEQALKMKSMLDQVRAKCLSDVRKRDLEIEKLKTHISGMQRGKKDMSGMKIDTLNSQSGMPNPRERRAGQDVSSADWSLEKETNDFLAALVNETSTENVALRQILDETIEALRDLTGMEAAQQPDEEDDGIGIPGQYRKSRQTPQSTTLISCDVLAEQMSVILDHCRSILKDPSFVAIEEVQARDEEIIKLRAGWEKMADRWKEAVTMMAQWKQRMQEDGRSADVGDFSDLSFGRSIAVRPDGRPVFDRTSELSLIYEQSGLELDAMSETSDQLELNHEIEIEQPSSLQDEEEGEESELELEPVRKRLASSPARRGVRLPSAGKPFAETSGNATKKRSPVGDAPRNSGLSFDASLETENDTSHNKAQSRLPKPAKMSVADKLAAVEVEAKEAEKKRQEVISHKRKAPSRKVGMRKTRRSTLSPEELAALMKA